MRRFYLFYRPVADQTHEIIEQPVQKLETQIVEQVVPQLGNLIVSQLVSPLASLFGYTSALRGLRQGRASNSMEPLTYRPAPPDVVKSFMLE